MKKCPNCNQIFDDDTDFCTNDGTTLVLNSGQQGFSGFPSSGEMPTQFLQRPQTAAAPPAGSSNILYLVIGVLATALLGVGLYLFLVRDSSKQVSDPNGNVAQTNNAANASPSPASASAENRTSPPQTPVVPFTSPSGKWQGQWTNGKGSAFGQELTLRDDGNGRVSGQIVHTLQQTINPQKMGKIGLTAVEFVQGSYDPNSRIIMLSGVRKTDPNDLIILDKYRLSISADNSTVAGETVGGKSRGQISLRR